MSLESYITSMDENSNNTHRHYIVTVLAPLKGVCADPVGRAAILEVKGPGPPVGVSERQLSPDRRGEKT
jgi:hypothetical protein